MRLSPGSTKKIIRVFVIFLFMLPSRMVQSGDTPYSENITINKKNAPLQTVIEDIQKQSGYTFIYNDYTFKNTRKVSLSVKKASLKKALRTCLKGQPVTYTIYRKSVYLEPKEKIGEWLLPSVFLWLLYYIDRQLKITKVARKWMRLMRKKIRKRMKKWLKKQFKKV